MFSSFSRLPPELRNRIWYEALPDKDGPALFFYKTECWYPRQIAESEPGYDVREEYNWMLEYRYDLLFPVKVNVPLAFVNREARCVGLTWIREQGIETRFSHSRQCHVFARRFDMMKDALYITLERWNYFLCEPTERLFEPDLLDKHVSCGERVKHIALPQALLQDQALELPDVFEWFLDVSVLSIIIDGQPHQEIDDDNDLQRRWELEKPYGSSYFWKNEKRRFELSGDEHDSNEAFYQQMERSKKALGKALVKGHVRDFEIRPVHAIKR